MNLAFGLDALVIPSAWITAALQLGAVYFAYRLGRLAGHRKLWLTIASGLFLLAVYRVLEGYAVSLQPVADLEYAWERLVSLAGALVLVTGLARVEPALQVAWSSHERLRVSAKDLEATAHRLEMLFRFAPEALLLCTTDGRVVDANDSALRASGMTREALVGARAADLVQVVRPIGAIPPGTTPTDAADRLVAHPSGQHEYEVRRPDGRVVWLEVEIERLDLGDEVLVLVSARDITERKALEESMHGQEAHLSLIFDHLPAYLWTTDENLRFTSARGKGLEALGVRGEDLEQKSFAEVLSPGPRLDAFIDIHRRALAGEVPSFTHTYRGRVLEGSMSSLRSDDFPPEVVGIGLDVTERAQAETEARANEQRLNEILDNAPVMAFIKDLELRCTYLNENWEAVSGIRRTLALGKVARDFLSEESAAAIERNDREVLTRREALTFVEEIVADGHKRSFVVVKFPLQNPDGSPYALCGLSSEITERVAMEEELHHRAALLDEAQTMAHLASWEWDVRTGKRYWSPHLYSMVGLDPAIRADVGYEAYLSRVVDEDRDSFLRQGIATLFEDAPYRIEHRICHGDGSIRWLVTQAILTRDEHGAPLRFYGFVQDITQQKTAAEEVRSLNAQLEERVHQRTAELEYALKELSSFSYAVSHDLRQPLRAIGGYLALVDEEAGAMLHDQTRGYLGRIQIMVRRMDAIIDDLLALSRLSQATLHRSDLDLTALAWEIVAELTFTEPAREVEWKIAEGLTARADHGLLRIALQNLLGNAFKFTRSNDVAHIEFGCNDQGVFFVRDDGAGFEAAKARRLFQPFQRMHDEKDFEGTGIGLATVARVVRRHGGWIRADSKSGIGATFSFTLPAVEETGLSS